MARQTSITGTESFREQSARAERWRLGLMFALFGAVLLMMILRRALGGVVMTTNAVFVPGTVVLALGMLLLAVGFADVTARLRRGAGMPEWRVILGSLLDLGVPFALLLIFNLYSPRGGAAALSGPTLLTVPVAILLSTLRLRPRFSVTLGVIAALAHWGLTVLTIIREPMEPAMLPLYFTYGVALLLTGFSAAVLAWFVRRYIQAAVTETHRAEQTSRALAAVERDMDIARDIQVGLLPTDPPEHPAFELAAMARPAHKAGGDYYDWQALPDGRLVVAVADVTGHGIGPALVMAVCRAYARATAPSMPEPGAFLERMNDLIVDDVKGQRFITMAVAMLTPDGSVDLVSAGHGPTFLFRRAAKTVEWFGGDGPPLGVAASVPFGPTQRLTLAHGDLLILLTDGFMERMNLQQKLFGIERLKKVIAENASRSPRELIEALDRAAEAFASGAPQGDDMTAVVVKRR